MTTDSYIRVLLQFSPPREDVVHSSRDKVPTVSGIAFGGRATDRSGRMAGLPLRHSGLEDHRGSLDAGTWVVNSRAADGSRSDHFIPHIQGLSERIDSSVLHA